MKKFLERMFGGKNKKKLMCIPFLLVAVFLFLPLNHASAGLGTILSMDLSDLVFSALFLILEIPFFLCILLAKIGALLVDVFLDPELYAKVLNEYDPATGTGNFAIGAGLATVRDLCYMFYIFFLLLVAFSTVIRSQAYSAKNILPKLVISIFLINFSDVITKVVIDFGQVFLFGMAGWMGSFSGVNGGGAGLTSAVDNLQAVFKSKLVNGAFSSEDFMVAIVSMIFTFMLAFAYLMLAIFLLVRLVMFAFLIVASPIAFFAIVLPSTSGWRKQWQDTLWKNVISGPVIIFFIYFSALMMNSLAGFSSSVEVREDVNFIGGVLAIIIQAVIPLVILYMAVPAANIVGSTSAGAISAGVVGLGKAAPGFGASMAGKLASKGGAMTDAYLKNKDWHGYADKRKNFDTRMGKIPLGVGRAYIELQAKNRSQISEEVKKFEDVFKTMTPDQMASYANSFTVDKEKGARAKQAMINTLMSKGKMDNENLMSAGFVKTDANGNKVFDAAAMQGAIATIENYGGDMSDVYKHRVDLAKPAKIKDEISKIVDKGELKNLKRDAALDASTDAALHEILGQDGYNKWASGKSQGENNRFIAQKEQILIGNIIDGVGAGKTFTTQAEQDDAIKAFQVESSVYSSSAEKVRRMAQINPTAPLTADNKINYEKDASGAYIIDVAVAGAAMKKFTTSDYANLSPDVLRGNMGTLVSKKGISEMNRSGTAEQVEAIRAQYEKQLSDLRLTDPAAAANVDTVVSFGGAKKPGGKRAYAALSADNQKIADYLSHIDNLT